MLAIPNTQICQAGLKLTVRSVESWIDMADINRIPGACSAWEPFWKARAAPAVQSDVLKRRWPSGVDG
jgi:hypothetical protein